jgi:NADH-quinone oxidoreductase subunit H
MSDWILQIPPWVIIALAAFAIIMGTVAYMILLERKVAAWAQDRVGPNRVGLGFGIIPFLKDRKMGGLGQPMADGLKFLFKEDYRPGGVDRILFTIAPAIMMAVIVLAMAVIPWGGSYRGSASVDVTGAADVSARVAARLPVGVRLEGEPVVRQVDGRQVASFVYQYPFQIARLNIGVLFLVAMLSLSVYGIVLGGWASNNKYSFLGALRATAQMISYEIPLALSLLTVVVMFGTLELGEIVEKQSRTWAGFIPAWNIFAQPLAFLMFLICIHAEANRAPFDLAEAEQELVGGYHTEYSSMRFALFFLAEYAGMIITSAVLVALFLGGWHFPGLAGTAVAGEPGVTTSWTVIALRCLVYFVKVMLIIYVFMWVRWSLPRFRFDQLMMLAWRGMVPLTLAGLLLTTIAVWAFGRDGYSWLMVQGKAVNLGINGWMALALLGINVAIVAGAMLLSLVLPAPPQTNRRVRVAGSRFNPPAVPDAAQRPAGA